MRTQREYRGVLKTRQVVRERGDTLPARGEIESR